MDPFQKTRLGVGGAGGFHDDGGQISGSEVFASGWLQGQDNWGRPNDVLQLPDGSLLVADDQAGVIYRITYSAAPD